MRKVLKILPVLLLFLALAAGCAKHAPPPPSNVPVPVQPAKADPAKTSGATNASVFFLNNQLGWAAVNLESQQPPASVILHTGDGGQNWVQLNSPGLSVVQQLAFTDAQHGWALVSTDAGNNTTRCAIMATLDGGQTWTQQWAKDVQQDGRPYRMQFLDTSNGFALLGDTFVATMDGGADWVQRPIAQGMSSFSFASRLEGWAVGANSIWHTTDGGSNLARGSGLCRTRSKASSSTAAALSPLSPRTAAGHCSRAKRPCSRHPSWFCIRTTAAATGRLTSAYLPPANQANLPVNKAPHYTTVCFDPASATTALLAASPPTDYPVLYRTTDSGRNWETLSDGMSGVSGLPQGLLGRHQFRQRQRGLGCSHYSDPDSVRQQHHRQQRVPAAHPGRRQNLEHTVLRACFLPSHYLLPPQLAGR